MRETPAPEEFLAAKGEYTVSRGRYIFQSPFVDIWQSQEGGLGFMLKTGKPFFGLTREAAIEVAERMLDACGREEPAEPATPTVEGEGPCASCGSVQQQIPGSDKSMRICSCGQRWRVV